MISKKKLLLLGILALIVFLPLVPYLRPNTMSRCIFCDIVNGKLPQTQIELETDEYIIFKDIKPASTHHYLAVTKKHIESLKALSKDNDSLVANMESGLKELYTKRGIDTNDALFGFHIPPFVSVKHLHMHAIAPRSTMKYFDRFMFKPESFWFKTVAGARRYLQEKC